MSSTKNKTKNKTKKKNIAIIPPPIISENNVTLVTIHDSLKTMHSYMVSRFDKVEHTVLGIQKDIRRINDYLKIESKIQEKRDLDFITKLYHHNHQNQFTTQLHIQELYERSGNPLTDFDGILLIHNLQTPFSVPLRDVDMIEYLVIESKHSLSKTKIDKKMQQMVQFATYLSEVSREDESNIEGSTKFVKMIQQLIEEIHLPLAFIHRPLTLLFASDDISNPLAEYMRNIYVGMDNEHVYDEIVKKMFFANSSVRSVLQEIREDRTIPWAIKIKINEQTATMESLRDVFTNELQHVADLSIQEHLVPYHELADAFRMMKHHIGYVRFGVAYCPILFPVQSLNRGV